MGSVIVRYATRR